MRRQRALTFRQLRRAGWPRRRDRQARRRDPRVAAGEGARRLAAGVAGAGHARRRRHTIAGRPVRPIATAFRREARPGWSSTPSSRRVCWSPRPKATSPSSGIAHEALISRWKRASDQLTADRRDLEMRALIERQYARWRAGRREGPASSCCCAIRIWPTRSICRRAGATSSTPDVQQLHRPVASAQPAPPSVGGRGRDRVRHRRARGDRLRGAGLPRAAAGGSASVPAPSTPRRPRSRGATRRWPSAMPRWWRSRATSPRKPTASSRMDRRAARSHCCAPRCPTRSGANPRPLVRDAIVAAYRALYANRERRQMAMPPGATAVATDAAAKKVVIATPEQIFVRDGLSAEGQRVLAHGAGPVSRIVIADKGERIALIGADGSISVRDLADDGRQRSCHGSEGAGPQAYFLQSGRRLLVASSDQKVWRLFDADTCRELASRQFAAPAGKGSAFLVDGGRGLIVAVLDGRLHRLSPDDLSDLAAGEIEPAAEYALAAAPDGKSIYVAASPGYPQRPNRGAGRRDAGNAAHFRQGHRRRAACRDRPELQVARRAWARQPRLFRRADRRAHVPHVDQPRCRARPFSRLVVVRLCRLRDAMALSGAMRPRSGSRWPATATATPAPSSNSTSLPTAAAFSSVSDRPSVTEWSFDAQIISRQHVVPLVIPGLNIDMPAQIEAFGIAGDGKEVLAAYIDRSARRWELETGEMRLVREAAPRAASIEHAALIGATSLLAEKSGRLLDLYRGRRHRPSGSGARRRAAVLSGCDRRQPRLCGVENGRRVDHRSLERRDAQGASDPGARHLPGAGLDRRLGGVHRRQR